MEVPWQFYLVRQASAHRDVVHRDRGNVGLVQCLWVYNFIEDG